METLQDEPNVSRSSVSAKRHPRKPRPESVPWSPVETGPLGSLITLLREFGVRVTFEALKLPKQALSVGFRSGRRRWTDCADLTRCGLRFYLVGEDPQTPLLKVEQCDCWDTEPLPSWDQGMQAFRIGTAGSLSTALPPDLFPIRRENRWENPPDASVGWTGEEKELEVLFGCGTKRVVAYNTLPTEDAYLPLYHLKVTRSTNGATRASLCVLESLSPDALEHEKNQLLLQGWTVLGNRSAEDLASVLEAKTAEQQRRKATKREKQRERTRLDRSKDLARSKDGGKEA